MRKGFGALIAITAMLVTGQTSGQLKQNPMMNPFMTGLNAPVDYSRVSAGDLTQYAKMTVAEVQSMLTVLKKQKNATFENIFVSLDDIHNKMTVGRNNCFMLYWVSPDAQIREKGLAGYQLIDSMAIEMHSDKEIYKKMIDFKSSMPYKSLSESRKNLVDDKILAFERSGVNLSAEKLQRFQELTREIIELSSAYSKNMNERKDVLVLDENGAAGLPENFKAAYKVGATYEIPIINATNETVMSNASLEQTRKAYYAKFNNRASETNLPILRDLVKKRDELAKVMGYKTYAEYALVPRMAGNSETVWTFLNDLVERSKPKAKADVELFEREKQSDLKNQKAKLEPWDIDYYKNRILQKQYQVNNEALREYFPMQQCLAGMFTIYQKLLGLEFRKVQNPSVWHEEVEMYEVFENGKLKGRFYLDLFPRANKETWFYGVNINSGKATASGYEVPVSMLLGNFTRPTETIPSLLSRRELETLFHEFGHIVNMMSYHGEFAAQADAKDDFIESMSQLFENWLWDYNILSSFAKHYKTGEVLPKATFDKMEKAKNLGSGLSTIHTLRRCLYDMNLYDKYNAATPLATEKIWQDIDRQFDVFPFYVDGTHVESSWIHINTHPVYMYGYLWSEVYAQDMFTEFEKNGLIDAATGVRYRELILANGTQRDATKAVEEFLGRKSNNQAYIKSLGLDK